MVLVELVNKSNITLEVVVTTVGLGRSYEVEGPVLKVIPALLMFRTQHSLSCDIT